MTVPPIRTLEPDLLNQFESTSLLRFIVCGSVDHGKSTLIGRLLYEAGVLFDDQLDALDHDSRRHKTDGVNRDFSLLLDGLAAEREQKITIDVAYRFFATPRRKFIVADAPGHEEYTRNMATGASTADVALLLVSASDGLTRQTRRHAMIVSMLGVRRLVVAINKMDLVNWSRSRFKEVEAEAHALAREIGINELVTIPVAARSGDNVVSRSYHMDWYRGPTLLEHLERVEAGRQSGLAAFRMPVQLVNRPSSDFRGYAGMIVGGEVCPGNSVRILPSGTTTQIDRIVTQDGDLSVAVAGQSVTMTFTDTVDASRGDVIVGTIDPAQITDRVFARLVWFGEAPLTPDARYLLKIATATVHARVERGLEVVNLETFRSLRTESLSSNDIATGYVKIDRPIAVDRYADNATTGSFILIDPESYDTVGIGMVETAGPGGAHAESPEKGMRGRLGPLTESHSRSLAKAVSWRATGSLDTFFVALVITGNVHLAGGVALTEVLTKILIYYLHERAWALISWGRAAAKHGYASG